MTRTETTWSVHVYMDPECDHWDGHHYGWFYRLLAGKCHGCRSRKGAVMTTPIERADCNWHTHTMFGRCINGLTLREYLTGKEQS